MTPPTERHLSREELVLLIEGGTLDGAAVEHLLAGCSRCMKVFHGLLMDRLDAFDPFARTYLSDQPDEVWRRDSAVGALWGFGLFGEAEARRAPERLRELLELPASERRGRIRGRERFRSAALVDLLREREREEGFRDPALSLELAELAVEVADSLKSEDVAPGAVADEVRALAWASLGNAQRVASDLFAAERSFRTALALPVLSPERRAELLSLLGSLQNDQARHEEARGVLEEAAGLYRGMDDVLEGKVLLQLAHAFGEAGDAEAALPHLERARELLGADALFLQLLADHYLVQMLAECGKADEADRRFKKLQPFYARFCDDFGVEQRRKWLAARIAEAQAAARVGSQAALGRAPHQRVVHDHPRAAGAATVDWRDGCHVGPGDPPRTGGPARVGPLDLEPGRRWVDGEDARLGAPLEPEGDLVVARRRVRGDVEVALPQGDGVPCGHLGQGRG